MSKTGPLGQDEYSFIAGSYSHRGRDEPLLSDFINPLNIEQISGDGSSRLLYRVTSGQHSAILVKHPLPYKHPVPNENSSYLAVREHLSSRVRVPDLLAHDISKGLFLLEDLGNTRLFELARGSRPINAKALNAQQDSFSEIKHITFLHNCYSHALDLMISMQAPSDFDFRITGNPDYEFDFILSGESHYFHTELITDLMSVNCPISAVQPDYARLAQAALAPANPDSSLYQSIGFIHRDYQSRNIMAPCVRSDQSADLQAAFVVIDFQGARPGPPEYDLASLLCDPYVSLPDVVLSQLIAGFLSRKGLITPEQVPEFTADPAGTTPYNLQALLSQEWIPGSWRDRFLANCANRLMQALGAFAKLGGKQEKPGFLEYIPTALGRLSAVLSARGDCPELSQLIHRVMQSDHYRKINNGL